MRNLVPAVVCGLGLLVSGVAMADGVQQSNQSAMTPATYSSTPESDGTNRIVCRHRIYQGMLLPQYVCATQHQWDEARYQAQREVSDFQLHGLVSSGH